MAVKCITEAISDCKIAIWTVYSYQFFKATQLPVI
jgi:hypothetical protein